MKLFALTIVFITSTLYCSASHVVGGDIQVEWVSTNTYKITVTVFRDCNSATTVPSPFNIGVYEKNTNNLVQIVPLSAPTMTLLSFGDECFTPTGLCVEEHTYTSANITLADLSGGYYFHCQIYARSNNIVNLSNSGNTGMSFYAEIEDPVIGQNSTPDFGNYPMDAYFCIGNDKTFDLNVSDPDGDSLVFSLVDPLDAKNINPNDPLTWNIPNPAPYLPVTWNTGGGYSLANIVGGSPPMSVDAQTGDITATAGGPGIYVFALLVEEYRNGNKIGETRRDIQFSALNCVYDLPPDVLWYEGDTLNVALGSNFCKDFILYDSDQGDTVALFVSSTAIDSGAFFIFDQNNQYSYFDPSSGNDVTVYSSGTYYDSTFNMFLDTTTIGIRFCWDTDCGHELYTSPYEISLTGFSIGCGGTSDTLNKTFFLNVIPPTNGLEIVPNVFTPNGDDYNEYFMLKGTIDECYDFMDVKIYNRWGQLIFTSDDPAFKWDGKTQNNINCPEGIYFVIITGQFGGQSVVEQYTLTLLR